MLARVSFFKKYIFFKNINFCGNVGSHFSKKVPRLQSIENAKGTDTACGQWREEEWGDNSVKK